MTNKNKILPLFLIIVMIARPLTGGVCPAEEVITPCTCDRGSIITCATNEPSFSLSGKFAEIHTYLNKFSPIAKQFDSFHLQSSAVVDIEDNVFSDIEFRRIYFTNVPKLATIQARAFEPLAYSVLEFHVSGDNQLGSIPAFDSALFDALSSLINARVIELDGHKLTQIPAHAFEAIDGEQISLSELYFNARSAQSPIKTIGNYAFYELPSLLQINLNNQLIDHIGKYSFDIRVSGDETLDIYLQNNQLTATSFEVGMFLNTNRPLHIDLSRNAKLESLHENVFAPILAANPLNSIRLTGLKLLCDCSTFWMMKNQELLVNNQVVDAVCNSTGKSLFAFNVTSLKC